MTSPLVIEPEIAPGALVRVISDLHLGHERCEVPDLEQLKPLLKGVSLLIVAGDLAETRECVWKERATEQREHFRRLCRENGVQLLELSGNHDPDIVPMAASLWGGSTVIMHGHAIFREVAPWSWEYLRNKEKCHELIRSFPTEDRDLEQRFELARAMCRLTPPIMRREGIRNKYLRGFLHCFWPPARPIGIIRCWLTGAGKANQFADRYFPQARYLVLGHFHRSFFRRFGKRTIANTGAWFRHATPYAVDFRDGKLLRYIKADKLMQP